MKYRILGSSALEVSVLAFGAWQLGDRAYWGDNPDIDEQGAVDAAIDAGINLFDTAEGYGGGASEEALGKCLGAKRGGVFIASKVSPDHCAPADLRAACEASLRRLGTDVIDVYQVHWPFRHVPVADVYGELARLRDEGKIREMGVSNFGPVDLAAWMECGACVSNQLGYNMLFRAIEFETVPACMQHGVGILAYMPLLQGILSGRWQTVDEVPPNRRRTRHFAGHRENVRHGEPGCEPLTFEVLSGIATVADELGLPMASVALAWAIAQPQVASAIIGARRPRQLERNLSAAELDLGDAVVARLNQVTEPLKVALGRNCDMWQPAGQSRIR
jgi:aryl-alcohol dehydrogenase-like predicted oxidoreductase